MKRIGIAAAAAAALAGLAGLAVAGSNVYLGRKYTDVGLVALGRIEHAGWDRLLGEYVDQDGGVDYARWKQTAADLAALDAYLDVLGRGDPEIATSKSARMAFWINAYNAATVRGILREYPTSSIRNHTAKLFGYNIWQDLLLQVGNEGYSLETIEHKILRKMDEPRIHFAIVCASIGCPRLLNGAYTPAELETQLADNTRDFFSRKKHFQADVLRGQVRVSPILQWFSGDFGPTPEKGLVRFAEYMPGDAVRQMITRGAFSVTYLDYDWGLNDRPHAAGR